jgi:hypothetical protein
MSTIDSKGIIDEIIRKNGYYLGDPQVAMIVEYTNAYGGTTYGVTWSNEAKARQLRYLIETEYVRNPRIIWRANQ